MPDDLPNSSFLKPSHKQTHKESDNKAKSPSCSPHPSQLNMDPSPNNTAPDTVDALLERYLVLLDEYTSLRAELSRLQTATFQHLARANYSAERGVRYGADSYDERMHAVRTVVVSEVQDGTAPTFQVVTSRGNAHPPPPAAATVTALEESSPAAGATSTTPEDASGSAQQGETEGKAAREDEEAEEAGEQPRRRANDPLRWFGVLTPPALRQTQACTADAVGRVVPRLVTVDAAMRALEIEVRRARKRRTKAEAAAATAARRELPPGSEQIAREEVPAS